MVTRTINNVIRKVSNIAHRRALGDLTLGQEVIDDEDGSVYKYVSVDPDATADDDNWVKLNGTGSSSSGMTIITDASAIPIGDVGFTKTTSDGSTTISLNYNDGGTIKHVVIGTLVDNS